MIFGEDFGQLAASGEYEEYKSGTTIAQLKEAIKELTTEEYFDSFLVISDDGSSLQPYGQGTSIFRPSNSTMGSVKARDYYTCETPYSQYTIGTSYRVHYTYSNDTITYKSVKSSQNTSTKALEYVEATPTITSWTLYRRQKSYDVAISGSKAASAIAPVQDSLATANRNYAVGDQFYYDGHLYKVTSAITSGAQIVIGTNAVLADDVVTQINDIEAQSVLITYTGTNGNTYNKNVVFRRYGKIKMVVFDLPYFPITIQKGIVSPANIPEGFKFTLLTSNSVYGVLSTANGKFRQAWMQVNDGLCAGATDDNTGGAYGQLVYI